MGILAASQFESVDDLGVFYGQGLLICRGDNVRRNIVMLNDSAWQDSMSRWQVALCLLDFSIEQNRYMTKFHCATITYIKLLTIKVLREMRDPCQPIQSSICSLRHR